MPTTTLTAAQQAYLDDRITGGELLERASREMHRVAVGPYMRIRTTTPLPSTPVGFTMSCDPEVALAMVEAKLAEWVRD